MFKKTYNKRLDRIEESTKKIDYGDFKFFAQSNDNETDFTEIENPVVFLNNIKINKITIEQAKNLHEKFNKYLKTIRIAKKVKNKKKTLANINMLLMDEMMLSNCLFIVSIKRNY